MTALRQACRMQMAAWMLAVACIVCCHKAAAIDGVVPENSLRAAWAPSRDEAVIIEKLPAASSAAESIPTAASSGAAVNRSLLMRRPRSLSRPFPSRMRTSVAAEPAAGEPLPPVAGSPASPEGLPLPEGTIYEEGGPMLQAGSPYGDHCAPNCCGHWNSCGPAPICCLVPCPPLDNLEIFGGVQGFKGPLNRGAGGSFGFHEGFNWGMPLGPCLALQWGTLTTQSNFEGSAVTTDDRNQFFLTAGAFRRVDWGLQGGLVVDYLHDESDYEADLVQLRGELSWFICRQNEIGIWFTAGVNDAPDLDLRMPAFTANGISFQTQQVSVEVNDLYAFFYRRQFACGGEGRVFGGFTANDQGLFGADLLMPLNPCWSVRAGFLYLTPDGTDSVSEPSFTEETWNVGISLVWTPRAASRCGLDYCRPLFNVADNGSFATRIAP